MVCIRPPRSQPLTTSSIPPTAAPRLESHCRGNRCQLSVARRLTACFMSASAANCLPASCCLKGPKRRTGYGATAENLRTNLPSWSCTNLRFPSVGLLKKHLAQKRLTNRRRHEGSCHLLATDTWEFLLCRDTSLSVMVEKMLKHQCWLWGGLKCTDLLPICHINIRGGSEFSTSQCVCYLNFWNFLVLP